MRNSGKNNKQRGRAWSKDVQWGVLSIFLKIDKWEGTITRDPMLTI